MFASFVVTLENGHEGDFLRPEVWNKGMVFKLFVGFLNPERLMETVPAGQPAESG